MIEEIKEVKYMRFDKVTLEMLKKAKVKIDLEDSIITKNLRPRMSSSQFISYMIRIGCEEFLK